MSRRLELSVRPVYSVSKSLKRIYSYTHILFSDKQGVNCRVEKADHEGLRNFGLEISTSVGWTNAKLRQDFDEPHYVIFYLTEILGQRRSENRMKRYVMIFVFLQKL